MMVSCLEHHLLSLMLSPNYIDLGAPYYIVGHQPGYGIYCDLVSLQP